MPGGACWLQAQQVAVKAGLSSPHAAACQLVVLYLASMSGKSFSGVGNVPAMIVGSGAKPQTVQVGVCRLCQKISRLPL